MDVPFRQIYLSSTLSFSKVVALILKKKIVVSILVAEGSLRVRVPYTLPL